MTTCHAPVSSDHDGPAYLRIGYMQNHVNAPSRNYTYCAMLNDHEYVAGSRTVLAKRIGADYRELVAAWVAAGWIRRAAGRNFMGAGNE